MIKIENNGMVELDGNPKELITEFACGLTMMCDELGRRKVVSQLLAAYYSMLAEERGYGFKQALETFKEDTEDSLKLIQFYLDTPGETIDEKLKNAKEGEDLDE